MGYGHPTLPSISFYIYPGNSGILLNCLSAAIFVSLLSVSDISLCLSLGFNSLLVRVAHFFLTQLGFLPVKFWKNSFD